MNIVQAVNLIAKYLRTKLTEDKYHLQYKSTTDPNDFEASIPDIYCFTMPSSAIIDEYPAKCPAICVTLDSRDDYSYTITLHLCLSSPSISDKEMAVPVENSENLYNVGEGENYNTESDTDLLIESILFTDQIYTYMANFTTLGISEMSVSYPDVSLPDFPYAVSNVSFKMSINQSKINENPYHDFY